MTTPRVSIVIPVHNALRYIRETLTTLTEKTRSVAYEVIVVDNGSRLPTKVYLAFAVAHGRIDCLVTPKNNLYFAKGNNLGASLASADSTHVLLLNSDVRINSGDWLAALLAHHRTGATAFGYCPEVPQRADGFCFLVDKDLYLKYRLDESFPWWWGITKLQAELLRDGYSVVAIKNHENYLHHYGGKSNVSEERLRESRQYNRDEVIRWFGDRRIAVLDHA